MADDIARDRIDLLDRFAFRRPGARRRRRRQHALVNACVIRPFANCDTPVKILKQFLGQNLVSNGWVWAAVRTMRHVFDVNAFFVLLTSSVRRKSHVATCTLEWQVCMGDVLRVNVRLLVSLGVQFKLFLTDQTGPHRDLPWQQQRLRFPMECLIPLFRHFSELKNTIRYS